VIIKDVSRRDVFFLICYLLYLIKQENHIIFHKKKNERKMKEN
jgi:hypothetical protein